jgi:4'-phosphopantetheinyl transferase
VADRVGSPQNGIPEATRHFNNMLEVPQPGSKNLRAGETHIWTADIITGAETLADLEGLLSPVELVRAGKFRFEKHRSQYIFCQGVLRRILATYSGPSPREIVFETNPFGKPYVRPSAGRIPLQFNMAHSESLVVIAVALERSVGVDTEFVRAIDHMDLIAADYFTTNERAMIEAFPRKDKETAFYICWTRKEAFIKAVGKGLSIPLNSFDVSMSPGETARPLPWSKESPQVDTWWLSDLTLRDRYVGALVIEGETPQITYLSWESQSITRP